MIPGVIDGAAATAKRPESWDESVNGKCGELSVRVEEHDGLRWMVSAWTPTPTELHALNRGASVHLSISAPQHPVVGLTVGPVPGVGDVLPILSMKAGDPGCGLVTPWDDDANAPLADIVEIDCALGTAVQYVRTPDGRYALDDDHYNVKTQIIRGRFSLRQR